MTKVTYWGKRAVVVLVVGFGIAQLLLTVTDWHLRDMDAYWDAAMRLRSGGELYPPLSNAEASDTYRYAPWFAFVWVPLTFLPKSAVGVLWSLALLSASWLALRPALRAQAWMVVALFAPVLIGISAIGNVHPMLVAALVHGLERRSGPVWVGLAASLKVTPILFVLIYVGRGEWRRAAAATALAGLLAGHGLVFDLSHYPVDAGAASGLVALPVLYALLVGISMGVTLRQAGSGSGRLAAAATVTLASPRLFVYDASYVLVGVPEVGSGRGSAHRVDPVGPRDSRLGASAPARESPTGSTRPG